MRVMRGERGGDGRAENRRVMWVMTYPQRTPGG